MKSHHHCCLSLLDTCAPSLLSWRLVWRERVWTRCVWMEATASEATRALCVNALRDGPETPASYVSRLYFKWIILSPIHTFFLGGGGGGTYCSARYILFKILTPTSIYHVYVCLVKISYQARCCLQIYLTSLLTMLISFLNRRSVFIHILMPGTSQAFALSVFLLGAHVHILLPGTQQYAVKVRRHTPWSRVRCHGSHGSCIINFIVNFIRDGTVFA